MARPRLTGRWKVLVSEFNKLEDNRYFDPESQTSFEVDHVTQVCICGQRL
jgi:capping protein alpha